MNVKKVANRFLKLRKGKRETKSSSLHKNKSEFSPPSSHKSYNSSDTEDDSQGPVSPSPPAKNRDGTNIVTSHDGNKLNFNDEQNIDFNKITESAETVPVRNYDSGTDEMFSGNTKCDNSGQADDQSSKLSSVNLDDLNSKSQCSPSVTGSSLGEDLRIFTDAPKKTGAVALRKPPTAREAAFSGPPRYNWIDVEASAALKVQSIYRRHQVTSKLQRQGIVTSAMQRKSKQHKARYLGDDGMPSMYGCCSIDSLFPMGFSDPDEEKIKAARNVTYQERKKAQAKLEERLRKFKMRKKETENLIESIEVVV